MKIRMVKDCLLVAPGNNFKIFLPDNNLKEYNFKVELRPREGLLTPRPLIPDFWKIHKTCIYDWSLPYMNIRAKPAKSCCNVNIIDSWILAKHWDIFHFISTRINT